MNMKIITLALFSIGFSSIAASADSPAVHLCKSYVQGRIDVLDADMHKGDKPNQAHKLLKRRDRLKAQYNDCDKNPNAYKKNI
jgi:hypothetical protein